MKISNRSTNVLGGVNNYYIDVGGERKGPYTLNQLRAMWKKGAIRGKNLYCQEGGDRWIKLEMMQSVLETSDTKPNDAAQKIKFAHWLRIQFGKLRGLLKG